MSLLAYLEGQTVTADPELRGVDARCSEGHPMRPRCGEIVTWHWAHHAGADCDRWSEESPWHLEWKAVAHRGGHQVEVPLTDGTSRHRADIIAGNTIIELQHSYLPVPAIRAREHFYGPRLVWVYDALRFAGRMRTWPNDRDPIGGSRIFRIVRPPLSLTFHHRQMFFDLRGIRHLAKGWDWEGPPPEFAGICYARVWMHRGRLYGQLNRPVAETAGEWLDQIQIRDLNPQPLDPMKGKV